MSIGEVLKNRRIELAIKQETLADEMTVTVQTVSKWERGITEPKASQVTKLSNILKLNEKDICQGEQNSNKIEPFEFLKIISSCIKDVSETELILTIYEHLENHENFIADLTKESNHPYLNFNQRKKSEAESMLEMFENGSIKFSSEEEEERCISKWKAIIEE